MDSMPMDSSAPKGILRYSTRPPKDPEFEMFRMPKTAGESRGVVIAVQETSPSTYIISSPPKAYLSKIQTSGPTPDQQPMEIFAVTEASNDQRPIISSNRIPFPPSLSCSISPPEKQPSLRSQSSSSTLIRSSSVTSAELNTPVMRSMFPRYDPKVPLGKQHYYPDVDNNPQLANIQLDAPHPSSNRMSVCSHQRNASLNFSRPTIGSQRTARDRSRSIEVQGLEESKPVPALSTPEELLDLWSVANGQGSHEAADTYVLGLKCSDLTRDREVITFISSTSQILYMLDAAENNLTISRSHPINPTTTIQISGPLLSQPTSSNPLMATIFPKLAELMALDQSSSVAVNHRLDRQTSAELQAEALERALLQEASSLFWDTDSQKYYLIHPTLSSGSPATFLIESNEHQITIFTSNNSSIPILTLSLQSLTLILHIKHVINLPSLYILDTLLTALLSLLLHLHRSSPSLSFLAKASPTPSPSFALPPTSVTSPPLPKTKYSKHRPWSLSLLKFPKKSKLKHRHDDEETASAAFPSPATHPATDEVSSSQVKNSQFHLPHPPTTSFQLFDPTDEKLPRTTRAVLKLLYWIFSLLFWALGVGLQLLAAGVVGAGKIISRL